MKPEKDYLGDGVYINNDGYALIMTTENGVEATNTIYLEPTVIFALLRYIKRMENMENVE